MQQYLPRRRGITFPDHVLCHCCQGLRLILPAGQLHETAQGRYGLQRLIEIQQLIAEIRVCVSLFVETRFQQRFTFFQPGETVVVDRFGRRRWLRRLRAGRQRQRQQYDDRRAVPASDLSPDPRKTASSHSARRLHNQGHTEYSRERVGTGISLASLRETVTVSVTRDRGPGHAK